MVLSRQYFIPEVVPSRIMNYFLTDGFEWTNYMIIFIRLKILEMNKFLKNLLKRKNNYLKVFVAIHLMPAYHHSKSITGTR